MARLSERFERIAKGENRRPFNLLSSEVSTLLNIPLTDISPDPNQPRKDLGDIEGMKASISEYGIIQPLVVSPTDDQRYLLIAGERRYTAAKALGLETVPAVVRTVAEHQRLELQLVENINRKDLNPLEEAVSYQRLINDFNITQEELGRRVGKSVASINQSIRLLTLSDAVLSDIQTSENVSKSVLLEIAKQPEAKHEVLWEQAKRGELTVKKARIQKAAELSKKNKVQTPEKKNDIQPVSEVPKIFRHSIQVGKASVVLSFDKSVATQKEIVTVLEEALAIEKNLMERQVGRER